MSRLLSCVVATVLLVGLSVGTGPTAAAPEPGGGGGSAVLDCADWRYGPADEPASLPPEYDRNDYKRTSLRDDRPALADSPQNHCGQKGAAVDLAWGLSRGVPEVVIAVLDSGIKWRNAGDMADLATTAYINLGEAQPPCFPAEADGDCNGDERFDITDFGPLGGGTITDRNGNGVADPEDLILDPAHADGVDDDGNGYVDDISGWDFLYGDNNPLDTVEYGHGTGEAKDSTAAENGTGSVGVCPGCRHLPVRVSDSFIADGGRFAAGVLFGLDSGADVIQEALGALSNPRQAQDAIDAAYDRGVVVVASMADEASSHPNLPASLERTMAVNSVTEKDNPLLGGPNEGYLALNGCTNFGGHTFVAVPSNACSSEATGQSAGMVGLLESYAREVDLQPHPDLAVGPGENRLSANETMQIVRATADDIDFSTPNAVDPANNFGTPNGSNLLDTVRYPSRPGWDATFGYGRINTYEMLRAVESEAIPPEALIDGPAWFDLLPAAGTVPVTGQVAAVRAESYDYIVEWAPGAQPPAHPALDTWTEIGSATGLTEPHDGTLATLDLAEVAAALPDGASGAPIDPADDDRPDVERFSVRLRVVVTAHGGASDNLTGEHQKQVFVHDDPDLVEGLPARIPSVGTASPVFADVDGDGVDDLVLATDDGEVHAYRPGLVELPGFPVQNAVPDWWPADSPTATADAIPDHHAAIMLGGPAVGDLDRDGDLEIVASDLDGRVTVWSHRGSELASMAVHPAFSVDSTDSQDRYNRTKPGFASTATLGDLDGDGDLEIVAAALDRHVYAWHHDGTPVDGFPVLVVDPGTVQSVDPVSHRVTFLPGANASDGGEIVASPTLADLDGDGRAEIVIGGQEQYREPINIGDGAGAQALFAAAGTAGNSRFYVIAPDGSQATASPASDVHPHAQAYLPGWPVAVGMATTNLLPTIGDGVAMPAAVGDVVPTASGPEIVAGSAAGPFYVFDMAGESVLGTTESGDLPLTWTAGVDLSGAGEFGSARNSDDLIATLAGFAGPSLGELTSTAGLEITAPTAGLTRMLDLLVPDLQLPSDDQLSMWDASGDPLDGSPQTVADLAFFVQPSIADLDGDDAAESIAGNSTYTLSAFDAGGDAPEGWPKLTGGWTIGTPGVGDWDGDGTLEVAQQRRDGVLLVWSTAGAADSVQWAGWGCDTHHSGSCADDVPAIDPACEVEGAGPFPDVPPSHPFCRDVSWASHAGIAGGYTDGTFRPAAPVSRGAMAAFLYRASGSPEFTPPGTPTFPDVPEAHPFFTEVEWVAAESIADGFTDGTYRPADPVSRGSMAAFLYRAAGAPAFTEPGTARFPDVAVSHPFYAEIEWAAEVQIASGFTDGTYRPAVVVSRGSMTAFLHRAED